MEILSKLKKENENVIWGVVKMSRKELTSSQIIIETFVKKALLDAEDGARRTVRNLVDLGMQFSNGRFQKNFFSLLQTMLQNEHSAYYDLITDMLLHVEKEQLLTLGMNIGYNSCTAGAAQIRRIEAEEQFNIPWCISVEFIGDNIEQNLSVYQKMIAEGQMLGIHTWMLYVKQHMAYVFQLAEQYPESAFIVFCEPETITDAVLEELHEHMNIMVAVQYKEPPEIDAVMYACKRLRAHHLLYSLYYFYDEKDVDAIKSGDLFYTMQQLHPAFIGMLNKAEVSEAERLQMYENILRIRTAQMHASVVLDLHYDLLQIDRIISDDCCTAGIDKHGRLCSFHGSVPEGMATIFDTDLKELLKQQFPKERILAK